MAKTINDVEFGEHGLRMDIHVAADDAPVVLYVHGGGFARSDRRADMPRIESLVAAGLTIATIDYRLAPAVRYPAPIDDVVDASRAVRDHPELNTTDGLGAIGASAGGYLAAMAALRPESGIRAVSPWFAPFDFYASSRRTPIEARLQPVNSEVNLAGELNDALLREVSTINHDLTDAPPFLLMHGDRDRMVLLDQSEAMHDALLRAGRSSTLLRVGGAGHEDEQFDAGVIIDVVAAWFRAQLR